MRVFSRVAFGAAARLEVAAGDERIVRWAYRTPAPKLPMDLQMIVFRLSRGGRVWAETVDGVAWLLGAVVVCGFLESLSNRAHGIERTSGGVVGSGGVVRVVVVAMLAQQNIGIWGRCAWDPE